MVATVKNSGMNSRKNRQRAATAERSTHAADFPLLLLGGVKSQEKPFQRKTGVLGVHWLQGTVPFDKVLPVLAYLESLFDVEAECYTWGRYRYDRHYQIGPQNVCLYFDSTYKRCEELHKGRCCVAIPGDALDGLDADALFTLIKTLPYKFHFLATRIDLFFDDYKRRVNPQEIHQIAQSGNVSGFKKCKPLGGEFHIGCPDEIFDSGIAFGKRGDNGAGKYMRIYDKDLESDGEINAIRYEIEITKERAKDLNFQLAKSESLDIFAGKIGAYVAGAIDFIDRRGSLDRNLNRFNRLAWWAEIVQELGFCELKNKQRVKTIQKAVGWVEKSVSATLGMLKMALGSDEFEKWLQDQIEKGESNLKKRQWQIINAYSRENFQDIPI